MKRFWDKVCIKGEKECWLWLASKHRKTSYGQFSFEGKTQYAHRFAWALTNGPIPEGKTVLHSCDNTACVNPAHLNLGTQLENIEDMNKKGRHVAAVHTEAFKMKQAATRTSNTSPMSILKQLYSVADAAYTLPELLQHCNCKKKYLTNTLTELKNPKYAGKAGVFILTRTDDGYYRKEKP